MRSLGRASERGCGYNGSWKVTRQPLRADVHVDAHTHGVKKITANVCLFSGQSKLGHLCQVQSPVERKTLNILAACWHLILLHIHCTKTEFHWQFWPDLSSDTHRMDGFILTVWVIRLSATKPIASSTPLVIFRKLQWNLFKKKILPCYTADHSQSPLPSSPLSSHP